MTNFFLSNILSVGDSMESKLYLIPEVNEYFYFKCIWAIAYSDNSKQLLFQLFNSFSIEKNMFLKRLDSFLNVNLYALTVPEKKNLNSLLDFLYDNSNASYVESIRTKLNSDSLSFVDGFISLEYEQRYMIPVGFNFTDEEHKDGNFKKLKQLFLNDLDILITHSMKCDSRTFNMKIDKYVNDDFDYIGSVNRIISDQPRILEDKFFSSRVKVICQGIDKKEKENGVQLIYSKFKKKHNL